MNEKDLAKIFEAELKKRKIKHIHVPTRLFKGYAHSGLKDLPDYFFPYRNHCYMVELKIGNRNADRIARQEKMMQYWRDNGSVYVWLIKTVFEIEIFWKVADKC
jgi:hypothetical protein